MPSELAIIGLTYDAQDIQNFGAGRFFEITLGLNEAPEARGKDSLVPGLDGQVPRNRRPHKLDILLKGMVWGRPAEPATTAEYRAAYRVNARAIRTLFYPSRAEADLVATLEDGSTWTIAARPNGSPIWVEDVPSEHASVSVAMYSVAPDWTIDEPGP